MRALPAEGHNLVRPLTSFVGRDGDLATVEGLLAAGCLVTLVGPGGVGKTRLATEVGWRAVPSWPDGVWLVDLTAVAAPGLVADAVALAVGAPAERSTRRDDVVEHLRHAFAMVVLDNAERQVEACAALVPDLLRSCPGVAVLVTSREPLHVPGE